MTMQIKATAEIQENKKRMQFNEDTRIPEITE